MKPSVVRLLWLALLILYGITWFQHAWISDDALITFRQVNQWIHGNGIVWNLGERVQAFTHPLWFFLLSLFSFFGIPVIASALILSCLCSALALCFLVPRSHRDAAWVWIPCLLVLFSQAFWDYTSSGLENPLSYLLALWVLWVFLEDQRPTLLFLLAALCFLNRQDTSLLFLPLCLKTWHQTGYRWKPLLPALVVSLGYLCFSLFYFGHPLPNTFLAKLGTSYPFYDYWLRFLHYVGYTFFYDPLTLVTIFVAITACLWSREKVVWVAWGLLLYFFYLVRIGGDFMAGRFFALPFLLSVFLLRWLLQHTEHTFPRYLYSVLGFMLLVAAVIGSKPVLLPNPTHRPKMYYGVEDERFHYTKQYSLLYPNFPVPPKPWPRVSRTYPHAQLTVTWACGGAGKLGFTRPDMYIIDICALASPYLSRLPAIYHPHWRIGHNYRKIPPGFALWLRYGKGNHRPQLEPALQQKFEDIAMIVNGRLLSWERIKAIYRINVERVRKKGARSSR